MNSVDTRLEIVRIAVPTVETAINGKFTVPAGIRNLADFRAWARSPEFPQFGRIDYLAGEIWVDLSMEDFDTHNQVKAAIYHVLLNIVMSERKGRFIPDRMRLTHPTATVSVEPDGAYVSFEALRDGRVRRLRGRDGGAVELEGPVEMVLEVLSDSSEKKDLGFLADYYAEAGVSEFWRADARIGVELEILRLTKTGYVVNVDADGWARSEVFDRSFRLVLGVDPIGESECSLEFKS